MRLSRLRCDGCRREPGFWEWVRGELTSAGYPDWRHPGIAFREHGCPLTVENRERAARLFFRLFGRPMPEELSYFCPECQELVAEQLPALLAEESNGTAPEQPTFGPPGPPAWFG